MAACLLASAAVVGCDSGRIRAPAVAVRVLNAAPERGTLDILREQRSETQLDFRQVSGPLVFDADQYDFNVRAGNLDGSTSILGSFSQELLPENEYLITITEVAGVLTPVVLEKARFEGGTSVEIAAVHAAPSLGPMSLYVEPEGVLPSEVAAVDTLEFGETFPSTTREPGTYRVSLTEAGNPANVLMTSPALALEAGQTYVYTIIDAAGDSVAPITVAAIGGASTLLFDESVEASVTLVNAAADGLPRDVFVDDNFSAPLLAAAPYLARSPDITVTAGARKLSVTPAGNTGVIEAEDSETYIRSRHHLALIGGAPGELGIATGVDDRRRIAGQARLAFMNSASLYQSLELFLVPPGTDISNLASTIVLTSPGITTRLTFSPGDYELIIREVGGSVLAGPVPVTLTGSGLYSVLATNGAVAGTVDLVYFEDFL